MSRSVCQCRIHCLFTQTYAFINIPTFIQKQANKKEAKVLLSCSPMNCIFVCWGLSFLASNNLKIDRFVSQRKIQSVLRYTKHHHHHHHLGASDSREFNPVQTRLVRFFSFFLDHQDDDKFFSLSELRPVPPRPVRPVLSVRKENSSIDHVLSNKSHNFNKNRPCRSRASERANEQTISNQSHIYENYISAKYFRVLKTNTHYTDTHRL